MKGDSRHTRGARSFLDNTTLERSLRSDYVVCAAAPIHEPRRGSLCELFASPV